MNEEESLNIKLLAILIVLLAAPCLYAQTFARTYGLATNEIGHSASATADGGYVVAAEVPAPSHQQFLVIKTDAAGAINVRRAGDCL